MDWPSEDEHPFKLDSDFDNNACLNPYWSSLARHGEHYKDAADAIISATTRRDITIDAAVYPAVFLYRHFLELTLKDIIFRTRVLEDEGNSFPQTHKLRFLWPEAKRLLKKHYQGQTPSELDLLDTCFADFDEHDPNSMAFRYPFDKEGNRHLMHLSHVNIRHLKTTMDRVARLLRCLASDVDSHLQYKLDCEADMRFDDRE